MWFLKLLLDLWLIIIEFQSNDNFKRHLIFGEKKKNTYKITHKILSKISINLKREIKIEKPKKKKTHQKKGRTAWPMLKKPKFYSQISSFPKREMGDAPVKSGHPMAFKCEYNLIILIDSRPSRRTARSLSLKFQTFSCTITRNFNLFYYMIFDSFAVATHYDFFPHFFAVTALSLTASLTFYDFFFFLVPQKHAYSTISVAQESAFMTTLFSLLTYNSLSLSVCLTCPGIEASKLWHPLFCT